MMKEQGSPSDFAELSCLAPAKLNLFLELLRKREDGYHELETVMVAISIFDSLHFTVLPEGSYQLTLEDCRIDRVPSSGLSPNPVERCADESPSSAAKHDLSKAYESRRTHPETAITMEQPAEIPSGQDNLVIRALERLRKVASVTEGARVRLVKRIPSQAGLGGASSDAAAALWLANQGWKLGWSRSQLAELAGELGSDIPFFFSSSGCAVARGRGEQLERITAGGSLPLVVVKPPLGLATPRVYQHCQIASEPRSASGMIEALRAGSLENVAACLHNQLQPAASSLTNWMTRLSHEFERVGCLGHGMSGSGSSYFGIFLHHRQAAHAARRLKGRRVGAVYAVRSTRGIRAVHSRQGIRAVRST